MRTIVLNRREVGLIGLCVFLMYGQSDDIDFDSIIGRTTKERNDAILALKNEISINSSTTSSTVPCTVSDSDCETICRMLSLINDGANLREAGFHVFGDEIKTLKGKFQDYKDKGI